MAHENQTARTYLSLVRAPFLVFTLIVVLVPTAAAVEAGQFDLTNTLLALGTVFTAHIAVNILNLASDYRTGIDEITEETPYSGGNEVLVSGALSYRRALAVGVLSILASALFVLPLILQFGVLVVVFYIVGLVLVVGYTNVFARIGLGELACGLGLTALPTLAVGYIQAGTFPTSVLYLSVPMFLVGFNLLLLNEFPDVAADRANGRVNLPVVFGRRAAGYVYLAVVAVFAASLLLPVVAGVLPVTVMIGLLPLVLLGPVFRTILQDGRPIGEEELGAHLGWTQTTIVALAVGMGLAAVL